MPRLTDKTELERKDHDVALTMPTAEAAHLTSAYEKAETILEYGSGGSTHLAASMPGKLVISVESDRSWAIALQSKLDALDLPSVAIVQHVDIGPTGRWGRPLDERSWPLFRNYPLEIWRKDYFRHPDVVLIDGRFRAACFAAVCINASRPVTVLFDDYVGRPDYHVVETLTKPIREIGRMAEFRVDPSAISKDATADIIGFFSQATYAEKGSHDYGLPAETPSASEQKPKGAKNGT